MQIAPSSSASLRRLDGKRHRAAGRDFGSEIKAVVEAFQRANGLKVDGLRWHLHAEQARHRHRHTSATRRRMKPPVRHSSEEEDACAWT